MYKPTYTVIIRTDTASYNTAPIDSLSSVIDRARRLCQQLVKDGEMTDEQYRLQINRVKDLIDDQRYIVAEIQERTKVVYLEAFQRMKSRGGILK